MKRPFPKLVTEGYLLLMKKEAGMFIHKNGKLTLWFGKRAVTYTPYETKAKWSVKYFSKSSEAMRPVKKEKAEPRRKVSVKFKAYLPGAKKFNPALATFDTVNDKRR